ncbi:cytochrome P450 [Rhodococcus rhodochrous]|uniref:cytochrome P450 n=1 Tax=Rhodococcus rhodochrous TaxID=1829 RepID=UPI0006C8A1B5|nr:cytochrome P450 [Rhodococcus rhodochrous]
MSTMRPRAARIRAAGRGAVRTVTAGADPDRYFRWRRDRDGDPFEVRFPGFAPILFTGHPEGARDIFRAPVDLVEPPTPNPIAPMVGDSSLILISGERHRRERKLLTPPLHGERMRAYGEIIRDSTLDEIADWTPGRTVDSRAALRAITLRVILEAVFGVSDADRSAAYTRVVADFLAAYTGPLMLVPLLRHGMFGRAPWDRFVRARDEFDALLTEDIARRRARPEDGRPDILNMLLTATYDDGSRMDDAELREELRTLLVAGHETTATSVCWALFHLHRHPDVRARVMAEVRNLGSTATPEQLARLPYLTAVCNETLRLHPPVPIVLRRLTGPLHVRGVPVAPGATVGIALPLLHSHPGVWERPDRFDPGRFVGRRYSPFEFAPFGGAHRRCIGSALADYEMPIVLATILSRVRLALPERDRRRRPPVSVPHNIATGPRRPIMLDVLGPRHAQDRSVRRPVPRGTAPC